MCGVFVACFFCISKALSLSHFAVMEFSERKIHEWTLLVRCKKFSWLLYVDASFVQPC